jgi:hypothetical protein
MRDTRSWLEDALATITIFAMLAGVALALNYYLIRDGFDNPIVPIGRVLSLLFLVVALPGFLRRRLWKTIAWWNDDPVVVIVTLLVLVFSGMLVRNTGLNLYPVFGIAGFVLALETLYVWVQRRIWGLAVLLVAVVFVSAIMTPRHHPLMIEHIALGKADQDNLFHASLSNMIVNYDAFSTGLDGLPYMPYHYGTHWIFGHLSLLLNTTTLQFYALSYPVIFVPLSLYALLTFAVRLRNFLYPDVIKGLLREEILFWGLLVIVLFSFLPPDAGWRIDPLRFVRSESQNIGVAFSFLTGSLFVTFLQDRRYERWFLWGLLPLLTACLMALKISQVMLLLGIGGYLLLRLALTHRDAWIGAILAGIVFLFLYPVFAVGDPNYTWVELFHFFRVRIADTWKPTFFIFFFFWSWVFVFYRLTQKPRHLIDVEVLLALCLGSFAFVSIFAFISGAPFFYLNFQRWLALAFLLAAMPRMCGYWIPVAGFIGSVMLVGAWQNAELRRAEMVDNKPEVVVSSVMVALESLAELPREVKQKSLLFIPQSNRLYWDMQDRCSAGPFVAPAVSGLALLDGMPDASCAVSAYGYDAYTPRTGPQDPYNARTLCERAGHFDQVIILDEALQTSTIDCRDYRP